MTNAPTNTRLAEHILAELIDLDPDGQVSGQAGDIIAEYSGEVAAFGDAGPGMGGMAAEARRFLAQLARLDAELDALPVAGPPTPAELLDELYPF